MNDYNDEKVLKSYIATSVYTIKSLEVAISELTDAIKIIFNIYQTPIA